MKKFAFLAVLLVVLAGGCKSTNFVDKSQKELDAMEEQSYQARDAFLAGNYADAEKILTELARERTVSQPLYLCELATVQLAQGREEEALNNYLTAQQDLEMLFDKTKEEQAASLWSGEVNKVYKGDPHESTALYMLIGTLMMNKGDYENAIAAFKSALLRDGDVNAPNGNYNSDYALGQLLLGECYARTGNLEDAKKLRNAALFSVYDINIHAPLMFQGEFDPLFRYVSLKRLIPRFEAMAASDLTDKEQKQRLIETAANLNAMTFREFLTDLKSELGKTQDAVLAAQLTANLKYRDAIDTGTELGRIGAARQLAVASSPAVKLRNYYLGEVLAANRARIDELGRMLQRSDSQLQDLVNSADEVDWFAKLDPQSPYATLLQPYNSMLLVWHGQSPYFRRGGDFNEIRQLCPGEKYADFLDIRIDGNGCRSIKGIGDVNYQAATRGERLMDEILRTKAQTKRITQIVAVGMFATGVGLLLSGNQNLMIIGGGLMALGAITYGIAYMMEPTADQRCWKNLPAEFYLVPIRLPAGPHKAEFRTYDGPFETGIRSVDFELRQTDKPGIRHLFAGDVGVIHGATPLTLRQADAYFLIQFLAEEDKYVTEHQEATTDYLAREWDKIDPKHRDMAIMTVINGQNGIFVRNQIVR